MIKSDIKNKNIISQQVGIALQILQQQYPDAKCSLDYTTEFELLVATIMSAQTTDVRVNIVTKKLFKRYKSVVQFAAALPEEVAEVIRTVGCFRNKARNIVASAQMVHNKFNGQVPQTLEELIMLPGVGRKTANVVLSNAFDKPGFAVDTHVKRVAHLLGWTTDTDPVKIEHQLGKLITPAQWGHTSHLLIYHGRAVCKARKPLCEQCQLKPYCTAVLD